MILNAGELEGKRYVKPESVKLMTRIQTGRSKTGFTEGNGWGLGWCVVRDPQGVTATLSPGSFGHGGAFGTQAWIDPEKKRIYILMVQCADFPNSDASDVRRDFQEAASSTLNSVRWEKEIRVRAGRRDVATAGRRDRLHRLLEYPAVENAVARFPRPQGDQSRIRRFADRRFGRLCGPDRHSIQTPDGRAPGRRQRHKRGQVAGTGAGRFQGIRGEGPGAVARDTHRLPFDQPGTRTLGQANRQKRANMLIKEFIHSGKNLDFIDLWDQFLGPDGKPQEELFLKDRLHNNAAGYKIRADVVRPHLPKVDEKSGSTTRRNAAFRQPACEGERLRSACDCALSPY